MDLGRSFREATDTFFGFLPNLLGFLLILLVGYVVAKVVAKAARVALAKTGVDEKVHESDAQRYVEGVMPGAKVSTGAGSVLFWLVFAFFIFTAIGALGVPALTTFMNQVLGYLPNVLVAIAIFVVAALVSGAVTAGVSRTMGDTSTGKIVAAVAPALVMVIAFFMILEQLQIAPEIVRIAFAATMGALALGLALAFGLGGRPVAQKLLEDAYEAGQRNKEQIKRDFEYGKRNAEQQVEQARSQEPAGTYDEQATQHLPTPRQDGPEQRF